MINLRISGIDYRKNVAKEQSQIEFDAVKHQEKLAKAKETLARIRQQ
jgi:hypothetical protein